MNELDFIRSWILRSDRDRDDRRHRTFDAYIISLVAEARSVLALISEHGPQEPVVESQVEEVA